VAVILNHDQWRLVLTSKQGGVTGVHTYFLDAAPVKVCGGVALQPWMYVEAS